MENIMSTAKPLQDPFTIKTGSKSAKEITPPDEIQQAMAEYEDAKAKAKEFEEKAKKLRGKILDYAKKHYTQRLLEYTSD